MGVAVHLNRPPFAAVLVAWGRHGTGWWACVTLRAPLADSAEHKLDVAAWLPAHAVRKPSWAPAEQLPRIMLPDLQTSWPAPPRWPAWYAGVWTDGPLPMPPGLTLRAGPAWRDRPPTHQAPQN